MYKAIFGMLAAVALTAASPANSAEPLSRKVPAPASDVWSGFVYSSIVSQSLFANSGFKATKGPASNSVFELQHNPTGLYVNVFGSAPLREWNIGAEGDAIVGKRFDCFSMTCDVRVGYYRFGVEGAGYWNAYDTRFAVSKTINFGGSFSLTPHGYLDAQYVNHHLPLRHDNVSAQAGVVTSWQFEAPLRPKLSVDWIANYHITHFAPTKGLMWAVAPTLSLELAKNFTAGPVALVTVGAVDSPDRNKVRSMFGVFANYKF